MAEAATASATDDSSRGRPYYEKLRNDLKASLVKKRDIDKKMAVVEESIARTENAYLEETMLAGNIIRGFDNYIKASSSGGGATSGTGTSTRRKGGITDQDRIFSRSSVSWALRDVPMNPTGGTPSDGATPLNTSARGTPVASGPGKTNVKSKKKGATDKDDGDDSERPTKRSKVSWGRD